MSQHIRRLREKRAAIHAEAQQILNGPLTSEARQKFDRMMQEMDALKADIDRMEACDATDVDLRRTTRPPESAIGSSFEESSSERRHSKAFVNYLRQGDRMSDDDRRILAEHRDMGTGGGNALQGTGGGYFVPVGFVNRVEEALKYYGNMLNVATIMDTATGQPLPYPTANDTSAVGEQVGEASSVTTDDVNLGNIILGAYKYSTKMIRCSIELLQDSAFNLENFLGEQFAIRLGRTLNKKFTTGTGNDEPYGIITAATASTQTVIGDDNASSPDPTKEIGYFDLANLEHSVDIAYRRRAIFMFHDSTLRALKLLKDKYGRPLWQPGITSGAARQHPRLRLFDQQ